MKEHIHRLPSATPGTTHQLVAQHFGDKSQGKKIYIQAALHADEIPAMLVATVLRGRLLSLEAAGRLRSEVVLVGSCNPIGLGQFVLQGFIGRFDLASGQNFNRGFPLLHAEIAKAVEGQLGADAQQNLKTIRSAWAAALAARTPRTEFDALQNLLMMLAHDADITLDLHCSKEATMHVYTGETIWNEVEPLARYLGARASLLAIDSGGQSFDEAQSLTWWHLQQQFGARFPVPSGNIAVTVEHRGQRDVSYELAEADADALLNYLVHTGAIAGTAPPLPPLPQPATPLAGSEQFYAPATGILVHLAPMGSVVKNGQALFDIVDPDTAARTTVHCHTDGVLFMGRDTRFVKRGDPVGRVSGAKAQRSGPLLSA